MANLNVTPNKTNYTKGEEIMVTVVATGLAPATPSQTETVSLTGTGVLSTGQIVDGATFTVTTPGTPAETVTDYTLTSSSGRTFVEGPVGVFKATA